jgi:hypothetical protein
MWADVLMQHPLKTTRNGRQQIQSVRIARAVAGFRRSVDPILTKLCAIALASPLQ